MGKEIYEAAVRGVFIKAMRAGYAVEGVKKTKVANMPGYKEIRYEDGQWLLVDRWCVNPNTDRSAGTTTIWHDGWPVWFMSYGGHYPQSAIPFLKGALGHQYCCEGVFLGGRGPARCLVSDLPLSDGPDLIYVNECQGDFEHFSGKEKILAPQPLAGEVLVGYHEYWGMGLY